MFTWLNKQGVKSDEGFVVQVMNRFAIKYSEAMGEIDLSFELGGYGDKTIIQVYDHQFYKWNDGRKISEEKKQQILKNFYKRIKFSKH